MAERMTSESWRVVRFSWYSVLWSEESAKTINLSVSDSQVDNLMVKPCFLKNRFLYSFLKLKFIQKDFPLFT